MADSTEPGGTGRERIARLRDAAPDRYAIIRRVTLVGAAVDLVLALAKIGGGFAAQSQSLVADGVHSLSDLVTDLLVLFAARLARAKPDADHPYGHERIETAATVALGIVLIVIGAGIAVDSLWRLFHPEDLPSPGMVGDGRRGGLGRRQGGRVPVHHAGGAALPIQSPRSECLARAERRRVVDRRHRGGRRGRCSGSAISMRWPRWRCRG